ncbi:hypothetical protein KAR91_65910 [Candidatus Pacearchaeota archaeon]|nr:hypothetical protein [Candidatus Pacearchaeota archaeon]
MLSDNDSELIDRSSQGKATLLIAPIDREFGSGTQRLMIDSGEVSTISNNGEECNATVGIEDITKQIREGEWEIREAFNSETVILKKKMAGNVSYIEVIESKQ